MAEVHDLILYDGVCGLCNRFIKIVLDNDPQGHFVFASLQSELARGILTDMGKNPDNLNTIYLIENYEGRAPTARSKARAALQIFSRFKGPLAILSHLAILPTGLLNWGYDLVASNRYRLFGRHDTCPLPNPAHAARFLDQSGH